MKVYLLTLIILLISVPIKSNAEYEQSTISNELDISKFSVIKEEEEKCYAYCFNIVQPILEHTVSIQLKEQQIQEQSIILKNLEKKLADLQAKVGIYEESIRNKDIQLLSSEKSKNEIAIKLGICQEMSDKFKNETMDKTNIIASKDELQLQMKEKLIEYKVKSEICLASSCIGKLNDIYDIKIPGMEAFSVPCDSSLAGSGWTVIQRRKDGSENFNRSWTDYREGFGDLRGEFFIGLEKLYLLTRSQPHELYISLMDFENETRYARYSEFSIGSEEEFYKLKVLGSYSGNAGDSMQHHKNEVFSTSDRDNDTYKSNCAKSFSSGWWYYECYHCNLNGIYDKNGTRLNDPGIKWNGWHTKSLKFVQMMIRPK